ncbi:MAG: hypothetical protein Q8861_02515 [Bacteroidota bacterium]|nr:hypothetical protein [Bacteroidota bacterium]
MYKEIIKKIILLLAKPEVAWPQFMREGFTNKQILKQFCYPLMGVASVLKIIQEAIFHRHPAYPIHVLIVHGLVYFGSLLASFYLLQYILKILMQKRYNITPTKEQSSIVIGYGLVIVFLLFIATAVMPSFFFLWIFYLYTAFLLWVAAESVFNLKVEERGVFVIGMTFFMMIVPVVVYGVLRGMTPNLQ